MPSLSPNEEGAYIVNTARGPFSTSPRSWRRSIPVRSAAPNSTSWPPSRSPRFAAARPRQRHHLSAHRVLFDRGARRIADQVRERCRARAERREGGLSHQRISHFSTASEPGTLHLSQRERSTAEARRRRRAGEGLQHPDLLTPLTQPSPQRGEGARCARCTAFSNSNYY